MPSTLQTANGTIVRQETASMIPVAILRPTSDEVALDMCASPGSKTTQLLEAFRCKGNAGGFVVANDASMSRACTLANRCVRAMGSGPALQHLVVTNHLAQRFPNSETAVCRKKRKTCGDNGASRYQDGAYDCIVCDVPCSGDGTCRKDKNVFRNWHPSFGLELHQLQIQIAMRGLALLKVGGRMTYSTCSFNPIENEAVVHELLRRAGGAVELVDCSGSLPGLITRAGWRDWQVVDDDFSVYGNFEKVPDSEKQRFSPSMFPPLCREGGDAVADQLQRCMRLHPADSDTGGFFVALFRKTASLPGPLPKRQRTSLIPDLPDSRRERGDELKSEKFSKFSNFMVSHSLKEHLKQQGASRYHVVYMGQRQNRKGCAK